MNIKSNPKTYTLSAIILGYLMTGDYTAMEQNAIGNWFMTIGQILECNSAIQQAIEEDIEGCDININAKDKINPINLVSEEELNNIKNVLSNMLNKINNVNK